MTNVEEAIREYLTDIENQTKVALRNITEILSRSEQPFDEKMKAHIKTRANTCVKETISWVDIENSVNLEREGAISDNKVSSSNDI